MGMEVKTALDKFYANIEKNDTDNLMFDYDGLNYMISYWGRYIITEDLVTGDEMEYCIDGENKEFIEAVLDSKANKTNDKSIREILLELPPEKLLV